MKPLITVVSGTWNRAQLLQGMIESVRAAVPRGVALDFIIVDAGSTDETLDYLRAQSDVTLIEHGELRGAITSFTEGANQSIAKYTLLSNDDVTFFPDSILKALVHLENNANCGAVAFADNRQERTAYRVMRSSAIQDGLQVFPFYAQVGLFRTWLGKQLNWWRGHDPRFAKARTYAGDNLLTANILEAGYTVDAVDGVKVEDHFHHDELREYNNRQLADGDTKRVSDGDAEAYYSVFPINQGPFIARAPIFPNPDKRALRILYLPIFEPGPYWELQKKTKRGLRDALTEIAIVYEYDYVGRFHMERASRDVIANELFSILETFQPDMMLTQMHAGDIVTPRMLGDLRARHPRMVVVNWNGDAWPWSLTSKEMLELLHNVDLQLVVNPHILPDYERAHVPAAYWQIAYEQALPPLPDVPSYDVLYMGNFYARDQNVQPEQSSRALLAFSLKELEKEGISIGIYGGDWNKIGIESNGNTLYDFALGEALIKRAKIIVGENQFQDQRGFVSNRIVQTIGAGGFMLHQEVADLEEMMDLKDGIHYVAFTDFPDMKDKIRYYLKHRGIRNRIARYGRDHILECHTFDVRVRELFEDLLPLAKRNLGNTLVLRYVGPLQTQFGIRGAATQTQYIQNPGAPLIMDRADAEALMRDGSGLWQLEQSAPFEMPKVV